MRLAYGIGFIQIKLFINSHISKDVLLNSLRKL